MEKHWKSVLECNLKVKLLPLMDKNNAHNMDVVGNLDWSLDQRFVNVYALCMHIKAYLKHFSF